MLEKIAQELIDGKKTYSVSGFAFFSNILESLQFPHTCSEWTELFNMGAAAGALILVLWRIINKIRNRDKK